MSFPKISTAIPQRRYRYGEFAVSVLGEIDSPDNVDYHYIMAFVKEGEAQPTAMVVCEVSPPAERSSGRYLIRIINSTLNEIMAQDDALGRLDTFCEQGLAIGNQLLGLSDEEPYRMG